MLSVIFNKGPAPDSLKRRCVLVEEAVKLTIGEVDDATIVIGPPSVIAKTEVEPSLKLTTSPVPFCVTERAGLVELAVKDAAPE